MEFNEKFIEETNQVIDDCQVFSDRCIMRDGFVFTAIHHPANVYNAIIVKQPNNIPCFSPRVKDSERSLAEHIELINTYKIERAYIIANNIDFITQCPDLKHIYIVPFEFEGNGFDYSPLYKMTGLKSVGCPTIYGRNAEFKTTIDYSQIIGIESIGVSNSGDKNYQNIKTLKSLGITSYKGTDLTNVFSSTILDTLIISQCKIKSLEGLQKSEKMQCLYLWYNRSLQDITALRKVKKTLRTLRIQNCPKITDFSVLAELENLELLELTGSNTLPSLDFIKSMKNLKTFTFNMNVLDGDLSLCLNLSYVYSERNRKHYNLKDSQMPRGEYVRGNESIDIWRRLP